MVQSPCYQILKKKKNLENLVPFSITTWVSVKFLVVGEINSMVGYHLMVEGHSILLVVWGALRTPQQVQGSTLVGVRIF